MSPKKFWLILKGTFAEFSEDNVLRLSAALAYYAIFSIGPLLVIVVGLAGIAFGHEHVRHQIERQLQSMLGPNSAKTIESMMSAQKYGTSLITTIVGVVALLIGSFHHGKINLLLLQPSISRANPMASTSVSASPRAVSGRHCER